MVKRYIPQAVLAELQSGPDASDAERLEETGSPYDVSPMVPECPPSQVGFNRSPRTVISAASASGGAGARRGRPSVSSGKTASSGFRRSEKATLAEGSSKCIQRGVTVMVLRLANFLPLLECKGELVLQDHSRFIQEAYTAVVASGGTVALSDGEHLLVHWNATKRNSVARLRSCETAVWLANLATHYEFTAEIGLAHGLSLYGTIGCQALSSISVIGHVWARARLLQDLNTFFGTVILLDDEVRREVPSERSFL
eukprot:RCo051938